MNICIESTRMCNLACEHCLRGKAQNKTMPSYFVDKFFDAIKIIEKETGDNLMGLNISGGEPSLNLALLKHIIDAINERELTLRWFYIATNGVEVPSSFVMRCLELYSMADEKEMCAVKLSNDHFHQDCASLEGLNGDIQKSSKLLSGLSFFREMWKDYNESYRGNWLNQGNYKQNYNDGNDPLHCDPRYENEFDEITFYLNCKGYIINGCDYSYKDQDKARNIICHVDDFADWYIKHKRKFEKQRKVA